MLLIGAVMIYRWRTLPEGRYEVDADTPIVVPS